MDDQQRAREFMPEPRVLWVHGTPAKCVTGFTEQQMLSAITAALRAAPDGWSFQRQDDGSIIVTAEGYGVVHVRPDDSDSIAAAMLHLLANDLAARPQGVK